jgi:hypothetical protein
VVSTTNGGAPGIVAAVGDALGTENTGNSFQPQLNLSWPDSQYYSQHEMVFFSEVM